ncbi:uncharacterized protein LOC129916378 [Episyrphus balteatus]|uniref:uncharacterized protein LOC129916378 n=1 Tax=Episyrphus balteatus TaxID=286459 RepID=UPI002485F809|nr:uncharacterized protein LOC129916378 [Episyrphus balteatus]
MASMEINIHKGSGNFPAIDTENTLSNVTSIQSQLQSLYDCNDTSKNCYKYNNYKNINMNSSTEKLLKMHASNITNEHSIPPHINFQKSFDDNNSSVAVVGVGGGGSNNIKMTLETQHHQKNQNPELEAKTKTMLSELKKNLSPLMTTKKYAKEMTKEQADIGQVASDVANTSGLNNAKTATILVSKSKTKTGLPLLLKNSIN